MHTVAVLALDGVVLFDMAIPSEVFGRVQLPNGVAGYRVRLCGPGREIDAGACTMRVPFALGEIARADTVIVAGISDLDRPIDPKVLRALQRAARSGARIASICSGAFVLAAAGLLDHKRATTHWLAATQLAQRYPAVQVDPSVLYVDEGSLLTSAGAAAGLDLCLHMVRRDYGAAVAAEAARLSVMPLERAGGQAQFIVHAPPTGDAGSMGSLAPLLAWLEENSARDLSLARIARRASMSERSLSRHFARQTGLTPLQWLIQARVRRAQALLETTEQPIETIADHVGFRSMGALRLHFARVVGTSPSAYRKAFRRGDSA